VVELLGREDAKTATEEELALVRLLTPIAKLTTGKQAVQIASEALEAFGGAGYVEDTGLPKLLRDAQVLPIWEGTTNVLALDVLRALRHEGALEPLAREIARATENPPSELVNAANAARTALSHAEAWFKCQRDLEAGARRFALTLGRALELALLVEHGIWCRARGDGRPAAAARRLASHGVDGLQDDANVADVEVLMR
jgi:hypothetical protein